MSLSVSGFLGMCKQFGLAYKALSRKDLERILMAM